MKNLPPAVVIVLVIGLLQTAIAQDPNPICQNAIPTTAPFDDEVASCKYPGTIHMGPSGGSPYRYNAKGGLQGLLPSGYVTATFFFFVCGDPFFKGQLINVAAGERLPGWQPLQNRKVCCDKWEEAKRTKKPCDVMFDADCDGTPNTNDDLPTQAAPVNTPAAITKSAGSIFIYPPSGKAVGRQGPDRSCSEVAQFTPGAKLVYKHAVFNKDSGAPEWYLVQPPSGNPGWIPASDTSTTRPPAPPPAPPKNLPDKGLSGRDISASPGGSRGRPNTSKSNRRGTRRAAPKQSPKKPPR